MLSRRVGVADWGFSRSKLPKCRSNSYGLGVESKTIAGTRWTIVSISDLLGLHRSCQLLFFRRSTQFHSWRPSIPPREKHRRWRWLQRWRGSRRRWWRQWSRRQWRFAWVNLRRQQGGTDGRRPHQHLDRQQVSAG